MKEKLLTIMFSFFCFAAVGQENQNTSTLVGDANGDGKVDVADIVEIENYIKGNQSANFIFANADVSNDNTINNQDVDGIMGIIMTSPNQHYYSFLSLEDTSKWDGILISTRGFLAAVKNYEGIRSYLISSLEDKNLSKAIVAYFNSDDNLVSIVVDNVCLHFIEDLEGNNYISYIENGKPILIKSEALSRLNIARSRSLISTEYGINTNTTFHDLNRLVSAVDILSGIGELTSFLPSLEGVLFDKILDLNSSKDIPTDTKIVLSIVNSLAGVGVTVMATALIIGISAEALVPMAIISTLNLITNIGAQYEDHLNEEKKILFFLEAGLTEIETLYPINLGNNKFKLGVRVSKTESLPETGKYNTFGLLLEKEGDGVEAVNLYSKGTNICMEENLICDGDFYIEVPNIEPGYKYFCRAFIMTPSEKAKREKNKIGHYNSYAFYGNIEEFKSDGPKRELEYEQISAENLSGDKVKFKAKVNVDIIDFSDNIEKWGVRLYKDDVKYELSDYIEKIYLRSGSSTYNPSYNPGYWSGEIEFEASSESLSINKNLHQAKTIDHWEIGTYVLYDNGTDKRESLYLEPFDLVYSKIPEAKTLEMSTPTKVTSATVECEFSNFGLWEGECGVEYWKEGGQHLEKYIEANQSGKYSIELTGLSPFTSYEYTSFIKVDDTYYYAEETKDFVTQPCTPKLNKFEILEKSYDYKKYHYKDKTYSFKFHCAATWEIETLENISDWGYKYIDPDNKVDTIHLLGFGDFYIDSRYAYYRNDRESEIKFLPYVRHGRSSARSRNNSTRGFNSEEDGYIYGDTITLNLIYDKQPVATTLVPSSIAEASAKVKCEYNDAAPWGGLCGVEYWSDDNHLQKTFEMSEDGEVEIELTGLLSNTTYQYRAFINAEDQYYWAEDIHSFKTKAKDISFTTGEFTNITKTTATLNGTVENYDPTDGNVKFAFILSVQPTLQDQRIIEATYEGNGIMRANVEGLLPCVTYYYVLAKKDDDSYWHSSDIKYFKTHPEIQTGDATSTHYTITLNGKCSKGVSLCGFMVSEDDNEPIFYGAIQQEDGSFSETIYVSESTTYKYYAFAESNNQVFTGEEKEITSKDYPVTIEIGNAIMITTNSARLTGSVANYDPEVDVTTRFEFSYSTSSSGGGITYFADYDGNGGLSLDITGLKPNKTYYYNLYIYKNGSRISSDGPRSFKTLELQNVYEAKIDRATKNSAIYYSPLYDYKTGHVSFNYTIDVNYETNPEATAWGVYIENGNGTYSRFKSEGGSHSIPVSLDCPKEELSIDYENFIATKKVRMGVYEVSDVIKYSEAKEITFVYDTPVTISLSEPEYVSGPNPAMHDNSIFVGLNYYDYKIGYSIQGLLFVDKLEKCSYQGIRKANETIYYRESAWSESCKIRYDGCPDSFTVRYQHCPNGSYTVNGVSYNIEDIFENYDWICAYSSTNIINSNFSSHYFDGTNSHVVLTSNFNSALQYFRGHANTR